MTSVQAFGLMSDPGKMYIILFYFFNEVIKIKFKPITGRGGGGVKLVLRAQPHLQF